MSVTSLRHSDSLYLHEAASVLPLVAIIKHLKEEVLLRARIEKILFAARFLRSIFYTLKMEAIGSYETSVPNTRYHIPGDSALTAVSASNLTLLN